MNLKRMRDDGVDGWEYWSDQQNRLFTKNHILDLKVCIQQKLKFLRKKYDENYEQPLVVQRYKRKKDCTATEQNLQEWNKTSKRKLPREQMGTKQKLNWVRNGLGKETVRQTRRVKLRNKQKATEDSIILERMRDDGVWWDYWSK